MSIRRTVPYAGLTISIALLAFTLGNWSAHRALMRQLVDRDARMTTGTGEVARSIVRADRGALQPVATGRLQQSDATPAGGPAQSALIEEIKRQLQSEMGLLPVRLLRERRESFVELNATDNFGKNSYGTAGYLGNGYLVTVKHGVMALGEPSDGRARKIVSVTIRYKGEDLPVRVIDSGDAHVEVHPGDWAIIKVSQDLDLPPLRIDTSYGFEFADPIFRLGNDYSKGIILSTGHVGQQMANGLVTCLTDGHPGVSGGGVLNQQGDLVGIPIGRMQGDYRFSFILPVRKEMFRKVPMLTTAADVRVADRSY